MIFSKLQCLCIESISDLVMNLSVYQHEESGFCHIWEHFAQLQIVLGGMP